MDSRVARLQARADSFLFQPFLENIYRFTFLLSDCFLDPEIAKSTHLPFQFIDQIFKCGRVPKRRQTRISYARYACFLGPLSCPKVAKGRSAGGAARQKRRAEFAYWEQTEASFVSRHTGKSTVRSQPGNEGNGRLATKRRSSFSTNLGLCRAPSEVQLRIRGRFV